MRCGAEGSTIGDCTLVRYDMSRTQVRYVRTYVKRNAYRRGGNSIGAARRWYLGRRRRRRASVSRRRRGEEGPLARIRGGAGVEMLGRPGSGEKYKRDNLLGPEAAEACFHGTYKSVVHDAASARGTEAASIRRCCERRVMLPAIAPGGVHGQGRGACGRAQISLRARVHGSRENREPPALQKRSREGLGRHAALTISRVAPLTLH